MKGYRVYHSAYLSPEQHKLEILGESQRGLEMSGLEVTEAKKLKERRIVHLN